MISHCQHYPIFAESIQCNKRVFRSYHVNGVLSRPSLLSFDSCFFATPYLRKDSSVHLCWLLERNWSSHPAPRTVARNTPPPKYILQVSEKRKQQTNISVTFGCNLSKKERDASSATFRFYRLVPANKSMKARQKLGYSAGPHNSVGRCKSHQSC